MGVYDEEIADALELIEEHGQVCEWHKDGVVPDDPDRPWLGGERVPVVKNPSICFLPATDGASGFGISKFRKEAADTVAFSTFGLMGAQDFTPEVRDRLVRDGSPLVLAAVDTLAPNGEVILHILSIV